MKKLKVLHKKQKDMLYTISARNMFDGDYNILISNVLQNLCRYNEKQAVQLNHLRWKFLAIEILNMKDTDKRLVKAYDYFDGCYIDDTLTKRKREVYINMTLSIVQLKSDTVRNRITSELAVSLDEFLRLVANEKYIML